jgi:alkanesulfonate monooxygenase SsuD/methylene tetrahydromethanopterin reductase-like flavin-dependent oxidoreductase (luciferase family)
MTQGFEDRGHPPVGPQELSRYGSMPMVLDIQIVPSTLDWPQLLDETLRAEAEGFEAAWAFDHLAGVALNGDRMLESFTTLGALAAATSRIALGTMVVNLSLREPAVIAAAAASVQRISGRPFFLGLGAGAGPTSPWATELHASGVQPPARMADRHARVEDALGLCARMWAADRPEDLATFPLPSPVPLRLVGVNSVALARVAGRCADGINVWWDHPQRVELLAAADDVLAPGWAFVRTTWIAESEGLRDPQHPIRQAMATAGIDRVILVRRPDRPVRQRT